MIWIICAMKDEADIIIKKYNLKLEKEIKELKIYKNNNIILIISWIGKIQASIAIMYLLNYGPFEKIINIWIAWNTWKTSSKAGDVFMINEVFQHDIYLPFEWAHLDYAKKSIKINNTDIKINDINVYNNKICATWDQFIDEKNKVEKIKNQFNADVVEMEAFAFLSVLREIDLLNKAIVIKSVSDTADENSHKEHEFNLELAMKNGIKVLDFILNE